MTKYSLFIVRVLPPKQQCSFIYCSSVWLTLDYLCILQVVQESTTKKKKKNSLLVTSCYFDFQSRKISQWFILVKWEFRCEGIYGIWLKWENLLKDYLFWLKSISVLTSHKIGINEKGLRCNGNLTVEEGFRDTNLIVLRQHCLL